MRNNQLADLSCHCDLQEGWWKFFWMQNISLIFYFFNCHLGYLATSSTAAAWLLSLLLLLACWVLKKSETNVKNMCLANTQSCLCMIYSYIVGRAGVKKWEGHLTPPAASVPDVLELLGQKCGVFLI